MPRVSTKTRLAYRLRHALDFFDAAAIVSSRRIVRIVAAYRIAHRTYARSLRLAVQVCLLFILTFFLLIPFIINQSFRLTCSETTYMQFCSWILMELA